MENHPKMVLVLLGGPGRNRPGPRMPNSSSRLPSKIGGSIKNHLKFSPKVVKPVGVGKPKIIIIFFLKILGCRLHHF